jgi:hypothetical protein
LIHRRTASHDDDLARLDEGILHRLARSNEVQVDLAKVCPGIKVPGSEFGPVVEDT